MMDANDLYIPTFDASAVGVSLLGLSLYLVIYQARVRHKNHKATTQTGRNFENMQYWGIKHNSFPDAPSVTLAVQTLRNTILVGVFVGGSSLTAAVAACDLLARPSDVSPQLVVRQILIAAFLFLSFLNWAQVIRFANHLGFYVSTLQLHREEKLAALKREKETAMTLAVATEPGDADFRQDAVTASAEVQLTKEEIETANDTAALRDVQAMALKVATHFSFGFRFIFFAIPFWMYSAGPVALVVSSGLTLAFLAVFDFPTNVEAD